MQSRLTVVFGGTGFLGAHLIKELVESGRPTRLVARRPEWPTWAEEGDPLTLCTADIRDPDQVSAALSGADAVVNATSLYVASREVSFEDLHVTAAAELARQAHQAGIKRFVQVSGIGTRHTSPSPYVRARARGESAVLAAMPRATIVRPSVIFGPDDAFLSGLTALTRLPVTPLFGRGKQRLQPVHVVDVARAIVTLTAARPRGRYFFELGGPEVLDYREILQRVMHHLGRQRPLVPVPFPVWHAVALGLCILPEPPLTRDQVVLIQDDNLVTDGVGTFADLDLHPRALRDTLPDCLAPSA
ncbi:complex I NDUFA9 subunit family protein [Halomonas sp. 18H]|uniref:complex I NDUFA9 subunit family protein n=1 Tax=Halomonas almeriensis TaxID=308163 RepID=UPI00222E0AFE|nr:MULTISPECIES: complex I NDUFA9 subunit family protein [Halomonas]MCW4151502.1 complex I NDUFA9 subunit family protein [Halomonas sp. 18H]MDN3552644.1 complex I NDUFA9 subunit family protein [Halomonas almeriensis]